MKLTSKQVNEIIAKISEYGYNKNDISYWNNVDIETYDFSNGEIIAIITDTCIGVYDDIDDLLNKEDENNCNDFEDFSDLVMQINGDRITTLHDIHNY